MKKMEDMLKAMNESMQAMQAVIQDQHAFIKSQGEAIEVLKSKITSGEGSLTGSTDKERQKQMVKDSMETAKIAKEAVPKLMIASPGNYADWRERLQEVLKLRPYRGIAKFLQNVGLKPVTGIVKIESKDESTTLSLSTDENIPDETFENFFAFLTSKLTET